VARPNFQFKKAQKEMARKKKKEQKQKAKLDKKAITPEENPDSTQDEGELSEA
jgi:hypothetical protein